MYQENLEHSEYVSEVKEIYSPLNDTGVTVTFYTGNQRFSFYDTETFGTTISLKEPFPEELYWILLDKVEISTERGTQTINNVYVQSYDSPDMEHGIAICGDSLDQAVIRAAAQVEFVAMALDMAEAMSYAMPMSINEISEFNQHSPKFDKINHYYTYKFWTPTQVYGAYLKGWITAEEFKEITGTDVPE